MDNLSDYFNQILILVPFFEKIVTLIRCGARAPHGRGVKLSVAREIPPIWKDQKMYLNFFQVILFLLAMTTMFRGVELSFQGLNYTQMIKVALGPISNIVPRKIIDLKSTPEELALEEPKVESIIGLFGLKRLSAEESLARSWIRDGVGAAENWQPTPDGLQSASGRDIPMKLIRNNLNDYLRWNKSRNKRLRDNVEKVEDTVNPNTSIALRGLGSIPMEVKTGANILKGYAYAGLNSGGTKTQLRVQETGDLSLSAEGSLSENVSFGLEQRMNPSGGEKQVQAGFHFLW
jgi:hypothetical protein